MEGGRIAENDEICQGNLVDCENEIPKYRLNVQANAIGVKGKGKKVSRKERKVMVKARHQENRVAENEKTQAPIPKVHIFKPASDDTVNDEAPQFGIKRSTETIGEDHDPQGSPGRYYEGHRKQLKDSRNSFKSSYKSISSMTWSQLGVRSVQTEILPNSFTEDASYYAKKGWRKITNIITSIICLGEFCIHKWLIDGAPQEDRNFWIKVVRFGISCTIWFYCLSVIFICVAALVIGVSIGIVIGYVSFNGGT